MNGIFVIVVQFLIIQNVLAKEITCLDKEFVDQINKDLELNVKLEELMIFEDRERSLNELWNNIKDFASNAWKSVKDMIEKTKEQIATWIQHIKKRANTIKEKFEEKLTILRQKLKQLVENIAGNETLQKCIKENTKDFDRNMLDIVNKVSLCISDKVSSINTLEDSQIETIQNYTEIIEQIENKLNQCKQNKDVEECLLNVSMDIMKETEAVTDEILKRRLESRNITDEILDAIIACSTDGLIEASAVITAEGLNIIQCLAQHGDHETTTTANYS